MWQVKRMIWPGNSPDLNAIEPSWWWMKRTTTAKGAPPSNKELERSWLQSWDDLPQEEIQRWIERIPHHIKEIIRLEGGNEYPEGRKDFKRSWVGRRLKGILSSHAYIRKEDDDEEQHQGDTGGDETDSEDDSEDPE